MRRVLVWVAMGVAGMVAAGGGAAAADGEVVVAAFGDSLSAGYGLPEEDGFAPQLQAALRAQGLSARVVNAAVSGDTSADGGRRVAFMLRQNPDVVVVALGANDMLRGLSVDALYENLDAIVGRCVAAGAEVVLAGMLASPNLGENYAREFAAVYARVAKKHGVSLYPFFLEGVALRPELNLADGLHPNRAGVAVMVGGIAPMVAAAVRKRL